MQGYLYVGVGGMLGSMLRYFVAVLCERAPLGTLVVNILGCFLIGWLSVKIEHLNLRMFLLTGFLGGFTTFSTFGIESFQMIKAGEITRAMAYILISVILGVAAVFLGEKIARLVFFT